MKEFICCWSMSFLRDLSIRTGYHWRLSITDQAEVPNATDAEPLTLFSVRCAEAGDILSGFVELVSREQTLPDMPLFLNEERYISVPLESTYQDAWQGVPAPWKKMIESKSA